MSADWILCHDSRGRLLIFMMSRPRDLITAVHYV